MKQIWQIIDLLMKTRYTKHQRKGLHSNLKPEACEVKVPLYPN